MATKPTLRRKKVAKPKVKDNKDEFIELVQEYGTLAFEAKEVTKELDAKKAKIKEYLAENELEMLASSKFVATLQNKSSKSMNEDKLKEILNELADDAETEELMEEILSVFEMKEVINEKHLETLVYNGVILAKDIAPAVVEKTSQALLIKEKK